MPSSPSRAVGGISTVAPTNPLAMFGMPDPTAWCVFMDDFHRYVAADWTITSVGSATRALTDVDGGCLLVTNAAADDNSCFLQKVGEGFLLESGKRAFFKARFKVSDATQSDFVMGLQVTDTTPLDAVDGLYFMKDDGDANLDVYVRKDATTGSNGATAIATVVSDTFLTVAAYYDGVATVKYYVNDVQLGELSATSAYLPDTELTISFGVQNGEAVAKTMTVDYIFAAKER